MTAQIIAHPALLAQKRRKAAESAKLTQKAFLRCTTRYLKFMIETLELMLDMPKDHEMGIRERAERRAMGERLNLYRTELAQRDARDNASMASNQTSRRFVAHY